MRYAPVLKWMRGEQSTLAELGSAEKEKLSPILEIMPPPWDPAAETFTKTFEEVASTAIKNIAGSWGATPIAVDLCFIEPDEQTASGAHFVDHFFRSSQQAGIALIPVWGPDRDSLYRDAVRGLVASNKHGLCLRMKPSDFLSSASAILAACDEVGAEPSNVDLVLDLGTIEPDMLPLYKALLPAVLEGMPVPAQWRSLALVSGAFPESPAANPGLYSLPRADWQLWKLILDFRPPRMPAFGDYGISKVSHSPRESGFMGAANIRYTSDDDWVFLRGHSLKKPPGFEQYRVLSQQLVDRPEYKGPSFSWGDNFISQCARGDSGTGNQPIWRQVGTSHHLRFVLHQLASLDAS